jgi:hypothetical protein
MDREDQTSDRNPDIPPPEENGVWNKRGFKTVDRVVDWLMSK